MKNKTHVYVYITVNNGKYIYELTYSTGMSESLIMELNLYRAPKIIKKNKFATNLVNCIFTIYGSKIKGLFPISVRCWQY